MNIQLIEITSQIILFVFDNQFDITSTLVRIQEHYESPEFMDKVFTLEEYKEWYMKDRGADTFTYYEDWNGFNFPSSNLKKFKEGLFDPLSEKEQHILNLVNNYEEPFYVIGIHKGNLERMQGVLRHEVAHGFFTTISEYKKEVLEILQRHELKELKNWLLTTGCYNEKVLLDECHAYHIDGSQKTEKFIDQELRKQLGDLYETYLEREQVDFEKVIRRIEL